MSATDLEAWYLRWLRTNLSAMTVSLAIHLAINEGTARLPEMASMATVGMAFLFWALRTSTDTGHT